MNRLNSITKPLTWFMALLLTAFVAGCGGGSSGIIGAGTVAPATVTSITVTMPISVTPTTASIPVAGTQQFVATAKYSDSTTSVVTTTASWTSSNAGATVGLHTGLAIGVTANVTPVIITATFGGKTATAALTVTPATLVSIAVTPATASIAAGGTKQFVATGTYSDLTTSVVTATASWTSSNAGATVVLHTGLATGVTASATPVVITATLSGKTATAALTVTAVAAGPVVCGGTSGTNCVNLLSAANYAILDEATVTFTPIATITTVPTITGDVAVSPNAATFMTGFALALDPAKCFSTSTQVTGKLYAADYSSVNGCATATTDTATILTTAVSDKNAAYSAAAAKATAGGGLLAGATGTPRECPGVGAMSDVNNALTAGGGFPVSGLPAGVYTCGVAITIPGTLTLNGNATDVWVFKTTGTLTQSTAINVVLTGGALPQNVFWQVANGVSIGSNAHIEGVILSSTNIQLVTGATVKGRLLARTGVLMDSNTVVQP